MKLSVCSRIAAAAIAISVLGSSSAVMASTAPAVSDAGWKTLHQLYSEAQTSVRSTRVRAHTAATTYAYRIRPLVVRQRRMTKREMDANRWARLVIRAKANEERRIATILMQEQQNTTAIVEQQALPSRERMVRAYEAQLPNKCSAMHTHARSVCLRQISLAKRTAPSIVAALAPRHAAAGKQR